MKKNSLTTAVVAGLAGAAGLANVSNAVNLNPDGLGQVLLYPYYTVNGGNTTLLSVVNTTDEVKAVKVRFLEALNSREVLDFNLYLSPFDVWTGAIVPNGEDGPGHLITYDTSCTAPAIPPAVKPDGSLGGEPFKNYAYVGNKDDDGPNHLARTREGHFEMIEMGVVVDDGDIIGTPYPLPGVVNIPVPGTLGATNLNGVDNIDEAGSARNFATDATHVGGKPANCADIQNAWRQGGIWLQNGQIDMDEPSGGLFGSASIVDVANGTNISYNADAIDGFRLIANDASLHTQPGSLQPNLSQALTHPDPNVPVTTIVFDNGNLVTLDFPRGYANAVSAVFMHDAIFNEFNTSPDLQAASEWVVTFPTKNLHIEGPGGVPVNLFVRRPFTDNADDTDGAGQLSPADSDAVDSSVFDPGGSCEPMGIQYWDREEGPEGVIPDLIFSPPPPDIEVEGLALCFESNVLTFNQQAAVEAGSSLVLGSRYAGNFNLATAQGGQVNEGWVRLDMGDEDNFMLDGPLGIVNGLRNQIFGLPVTGFWAANYINANAAPGMLANYSGVHKHRGSRFGLTVDVNYGPDEVGVPTDNNDDGFGDDEIITPTGFAWS